MQQVGTSQCLPQGVMPWLRLDNYLRRGLESGAIPAQREKLRAVATVISAFTGGSLSFAITLHVSSEIPDKPANAQELSPLGFLHPGPEDSVGSQQAWHQGPSLRM